jgi:hypothetical protein
MTACHLPRNKPISAIAPANSIGNTHSNASTTATEITIRQNITSPLITVLQQYPEPYNNKIRETAVSHRSFQHMLESSVRGFDPTPSWNP